MTKPSSNLQGQGFNRGNVFESGATLERIRDAEAYASLRRFRVQRSNEKDVKDGLRKAYALERVVKSGNYDSAAYRLATSIVAIRRVVEFAGDYYVRRRKDPRSATYESVCALSDEAALLINRIVEETPAKSSKDLSKAFQINKTIEARLLKQIDRFDADLLFALGKYPAAK